MLFRSRDFPNLDWEVQRRLFLLLGQIGVEPGKKLRVQSLRRFYRDHRAQVYRSHYEVDVDVDQILVDALIILFESPLR